MFLGREKELDYLVKHLNSNKKEVILIYGTRRVGKSSLIQESLKKYSLEKNDTVIVNHLCIQSSYHGNLIHLQKSICSSLKIPNTKFETIFDIFE